MGQKVIEIENLTKIFGEKLIAVNNANFSVEERAIFGFLGPNGAGKTTTIRLLLGLIRPTAGEVRVFGEKMTPSSSNLRKKMGYLPTNPKFPPRMTPITYLDFVGKLFHLGREERMKRLSNLIRSVGLLGDSSREIAGFSTGMLTRLGLAAALMNDPQLLILDEPTSGLDPAGRKVNFRVDSRARQGEDNFRVLSHPERHRQDMHGCRCGKRWEGHLLGLDEGDEEEHQKPRHSSGIGRGCGKVLRSAEDCKVGIEF